MLSNASLAPSTKRASLKRTAAWFTDIQLAKPLAIAIAALFFCLFSQKPAQAQLTIEKLIGSSVSEIGPKYNDVQEAIKRFNNGDAKGASGLLELAKKSAPELPPTEVMLAKMFYLKNNAKAGRQMLEEAVKKNPNDPEAYLIFADQALRQGFLTDAEFLYAKGHDVGHSFKENPKRKRTFDMAAHNGMATIAERRQNWPEAKKQLEGLLELDPENAQALQRLAVMQFRMDDADGARKTFDRVSKLDKSKKSVPADVWMGRLYSQKGDKEEATKYFGAALKSSSGNAATRLAVARWLLEQGEDRRAKAQVELALKNDPNSVEALFLMGALNRVAKDYSAAEKNLAKAHLLSPNSLEPINQMALTLIQKEGQEEKERGLQFAAMSNQLFPKNATAKVTYAWALSKLDRRSDAFRVMGEAQKLGGITGDNAYRTALFLVEIKRGKDAIAVLEQIVDQPGIVLHRKDAKELLARLQSGASK